ncbi:hypothetical protein [Krasilnikovia sp. MM14-A1259]|uniref:hypothetical protein n=1 Tax=Krasilnikovia sp. MM14-A1259 TaxID=3373539 RepID=UPI003818A503
MEQDETTPWAPLSRRIAGIGPDPTLYDGVPDHLRPAMRSWARDRWNANPYALEELQWRLQQALEVEDLDYIDGEPLLDIIDGVLRWWPKVDLDDPKRYTWVEGVRHQYPGPRSLLSDALNGGGSAWRVMPMAMPWNAGSMTP